MARFGAALLLLLLLPPQVASQVAAPSPPPCTCTNVAWCDPISTPPAAREIFAFHSGSRHGTAWRTYDFSQITTLAVFDGITSEMLCFAHSKGVRVVFVSKLEVASVGNSSLEAAYVNAEVLSLVSYRADGISLDIEDFNGPPSAMTNLTRRLATAIRAVRPTAQISFCVSFNSIRVSWAATHGYDIRAISAEVDFLVSMAYR